MGNRLPHRRYSHDHQGLPAGQLVLAAVAPGNAASVRALLAAGFAPLGSLQLFRRAATQPVPR